MINIDYTNPIDDDDIIGWKSNRGWIYLTLLGVSAPKEKIPKKLLGGMIKRIAIDDFDESTQIAILINKPILGYDIINSEFSPSTIVFIHTEMKQSQIYNLKNHIRNNGESVFNVSKKSGFPDYNTSFKSAFDQARKELGPNSIFSYHGKLYTTNHPSEKELGFTSALEQKIKASYKKNTINEVYVDKETGEKLIEKSDDILLNKKYSFFKNKIVTDKINLDTLSYNLNNKYNNKDSIVNKSKNIDKTSLLKKNVFKSFKNKIKDKTNKSKTNEKTFYYLDERNKDETLPDTHSHGNSNLDSLSYWYDNNKNTNWLNDKFPKRDKTYSGYHPNWSFPDDRESLDYSPDDQLIFEKPESFPKRIVDPGFSYFYNGGIRVDANMSGVPIYIDGKYVGETPLNKPIQVEPGWHQVSGFSPFYKRLSSSNNLQFINFDPMIQNNELYGSETTYIESGKIETVVLKFNHIGDTPKKWKEINGGMIIGAPLISFIFGLILWGIA